MSLREEVRVILEAVEEHGAIPFKGEKKYIPHMTVAQATDAILNAIEKNRWLCASERLQVLTDKSRLEGGK